MIRNVDFEPTWGISDLRQAADEARAALDEAVTWMKDNPTEETEEITLNLLFAVGALDFAGRTYGSLELPVRWVTMCAVALHRYKKFKLSQGTT